MIFTVYDREVRGWLGKKELHDLLADMSLSDKNPNEFGIRNRLWSERHEENKCLISDEFSVQTLSQVSHTHIHTNTSKLTFSNSSLA